MKTEDTHKQLNETVVNIAGWICVAILFSLPFLSLLFSKEPTGCLVKTTERENRLQIELNCPMTPFHASEVSGNKE